MQFSSLDGPLPLIPSYLTSRFSYLIFHMIKAKSLFSNDFCPLFSPIFRILGVTI